MRTSLYEELNKAKRTNVCFEANVSSLVVYKVIMRSRTKWTTHVLEMLSVEDLYSVVDIDTRLKRARSWLSRRLVFSQAITANHLRFCFYDGYD